MPGRVVQCRPELLRQRWTGASPDLSSQFRFETEWPLVSVPVDERSEGSNLGPKAVKEIIEGRYEGGDTLVLENLGHII